MASFKDSAALGAVAPPLGVLSLADTGLKKLAGTYSPQQQAVDPAVIALRDQQIDQAKKFRSELPSYQDDQYRQAENQSRNDLAQKMAGARSAANSRGLLYSGIREGAEAGAGAAEASNLANQRAKINQATLSQANQMEQGAVQSGLAVQQAQNQANTENYNANLAANEKRSKGLMGLLGGAGGAVGMAAGGAGGGGK